MKKFGTTGLSKCASVVSVTVGLVVCWVPTERNPIPIDTNRMIVAKTIVLGRDFTTSTLLGEWLLFGTYGLFAVRNDARAEGTTRARVQEKTKPSPYRGDYSWKSPPSNTYFSNTTVAVKGGIVCR